MERSMRCVMKTWKFGCFSLLFAGLLVGCGQQTKTVTETSVNESTLADASDGLSGLPLLAVPQPDDGKGKKPTLLPKLPFAKKKNTPADDAPPGEDQAAAKGPEKGSPEWLLREIQRVQLLPLPFEETAEKEEDDDEDDKELTPQQ